MLSRFLASDALLLSSTLQGRRTMLFLHALQFCRAVVLENMPLSNQNECVRQMEECNQQNHSGCVYADPGEDPS